MACSTAGESSGADIYVSIDIPMIILPPYQEANGMIGDLMWHLELDFTEPHYTFPSL